MDAVTVVLKPAEVASMLGVSLRRTYQLIAAGKIPATRLGHSIWIPRSAWDEWLSDQAARALGSVRSPSADSAGAPEERP